MAIMSNKVSYTNLAIKPPVTLRMQLAKANILGAKSKLGTTKDTTTVDNVRWGLTVEVCKEGEPDCTTSYKAVTVVFRSIRAESKWVIDVYFEDYYVTPSAMFEYDAFKFGSETDVNIDIQFRDSTVTIVFNGNTLITTDTFKKFEQVRKLSSLNYFTDPAGAEVAGVADQYLVYNLQVISVQDFTAIVNAIIPIAITLAVVAVVFALIRSGLLKLPLPVPKAT